MAIVFRGQGFNGLFLFCSLSLSSTSFCICLHVQCFYIFSYSVDVLYFYAYGIVNKYTYMYIHKQYFCSQLSVTKEYSQCTENTKKSIVWFCAAYGIIECSIFCNVFQGLQLVELKSTFLR